LPVKNVKFPLPRLVIFPEKVKLLLKAGVVAGVVVVAVVAVVAGAAVAVVVVVVGAAVQV
jgi:hypothetical protein